MDIMNDFRPGRWLNNETTTKDGDYMPFGCGPRYCLGATLAMVEMKIVLAVMARKLDFSIIDVDPENIKWKQSNLIAVPQDGVNLSDRSTVS
jgi:cytochrome P450